MASHALHLWQTERRAALDQIVAAHSALGGSGPGRRYTTHHVNQAYAVLLSSHFQGFCRDLHSEAVDHLVGVVQPDALKPLLRVRLTEGRKLDRGNPNPGHLGADFGRFSLEFWPAIRSIDERNRRRQERLAELTDWRNAIAHQDFSPAWVAQSGSLGLERVDRWRSACDQLARAFDGVLEKHLIRMTATPPW